LGCLEKIFAEDLPFREFRTFCSITISMGNRGGGGLGKNLFLTTQDPL